MPSEYPIAKRRRRSLLLACSFLVPAAALSASAASAQQVAPDQLPPVEVVKPGDQNQTRARAVGDNDVTTRRSAQTASQTGTPGGAPTGDGSGTGSATFSQSNGIVGASTTVITASDIAHSPAQSLAEIIATQTPGVQLQTLYGGFTGAYTSVDLRGFGAFQTANTLVLINGRRLNDIDMAQVDLSSIPLNSIERVEITRGNSGAVLYGDNAVGGVINIITKNGVGGPPAALQVEGGFGSFNTQLGSVSTSLNSGPWSASFYGNAVKSDGYRENNQYVQRNGTGTLNYTSSDLTAFFNVTGDKQELGFPGGRLVNPAAGIDQLATDRRGTDTPFDYGNQQGASATAGFTKTLVNGVDLIVDGGVRDKRQQGGFFGDTPAPSFASSYRDVHLTTWSITPRLSVKSLLFGLPSQLLTGIDYYDASYRQNFGEFEGLDPWHRYNLSQETLAGYFQHTLGLAPTTDFSYGARVQNINLSARDHFDPNAPGAYDTQALPLDSNETQYALHVGLEHRLNDVFTVFGRAARAFRTPDVDERVASGPAFDPLTFAPIPQTFKLKTQTSEDVEGGFRIKAGALQTQTSFYLMDLTNEIHYDPVNFYNYNLDPTRRYGSETSISYRFSDTLMFRTGMAYTRAIFREGIYAGNDVPLVSRYTASAGVTWNIWQNYLVLDATARLWTNRRMDNDQPNIQPTIPGNGTIDLKLSGKYDRYFWSLSVNNLLNTPYYDYAIASAFSQGVFNAYPLPGRTYLLKAGATF